MGTKVVGGDILTKQVHVVPDTPLVQFRMKLEVRFQKPVTLLQLTAAQLGITHHQSRHKLGPGFPALPHQKKPVSFLRVTAQPHHTPPAS